MTRLFLILICLLASACGGAVRQKPSLDVSMVFYDIGETRALEPVIEILKERNLSVGVLAFGTSRELVEDRPEFINPNADCGVSADVDPEKWQRHAALDSEDLRKVGDCLDSRLIVTGMASRLQTQIAEVFNKDRHIPVWGYFDGFSADAVKEVQSPAVSPLELVLVPSRSVEKAFEKKFPKEKMKAVGQPTLERWKKTIERVDARALRDELRLDPEKSVLLYAGGYGEGYEESFRLFVRAARDLGNYQVLISLHPKVGGDFEKSVLETEAAENMHIISKKTSTAEALAVSDILVCHRSTVGVQAVFAGKPVIYLDFEKNKYSDLAIENRLAKQVFSKEEFQRAILSIRAGSKKNAYANYGVPEESAKLIADLIMEQVRISNKPFQVAP